MGVAGCTVGELSVCAVGGLVGINVLVCPVCCLMWVCVFVWQRCGGCLCRGQGKLCVCVYVVGCGRVKMCCECGGYEC